jgi:hypothetical protein
MAIVSLKDAGLMTGKGSATIYRHIKSGKLSKTGDGIETSELIRVYGELKKIEDGEKIDNSHFEKNGNDFGNDKLSLLEDKISALNDVVAELRQDKQELYSTIKFYQSLLTGPGQSSETTHKEVVIIESNSKESLTQRIIRKLFW